MLTLNMKLLIISETITESEPQAVLPVFCVRKLRKMPKKMSINCLNDID